MEGERREERERKEEKGEGLQGDERNKYPMETPCDGGIYGNLPDQILTAKHCSFCRMRNKLHEHKLCHLAISLACQRSWEQGRDIL